MPKAKKNTVQDGWYELAAKFLFGNAVLTPEFMKDLQLLVDDRFHKINCCVLWEHNRNFMKLISKHHLPRIGKKSVKMDECIQGSMDYKYANYKILEN